MSLTPIGCYGSLSFKKGELRQHRCLMVILEPHESPSSSFTPPHTPPHPVSLSLFLVFCESYLLCSKSFPAAPHESLRRYMSTHNLHTLDCLSLFFYSQVFNFFVYKILLSSSVCLSLPHSLPPPQSPLPLARARQRHLERQTRTHTHTLTRRGRARQALNYSAREKPISIKLSQ